MKLYLRVHQEWLPKENTEGIPEFDQVIENVLLPFGSKIAGMSFDSGLLDLFFETVEFETAAQTESG